jgi:hypothetical protein
MDLETCKRFERIYSEARKKVSEDIKKKKEDSHRGENEFINLIRFKPIPAMLASFLSFVLILCALMMFFPMKDVVLQLIILHLTVLMQISIILILAVSSGALPRISPCELWMLQAEEIRKIWSDEGGNIEDLKKTVKLRIFYYEQMQKFFLGTLSAFVLFFAMEKNFLGENKIISLKDFPYPLQTYALIFNVLLVAYFIWVHTPLQWHRQIGFCINELSDEK